MALQDDLLKLVQKASIDGTLTPVAVEYTQKLIAENAALITQLSDAKKRADDQSARASTAETRAAALIAESTAVAAREAAVAIREKESTTLELTAKHEAKRVEDHKAMFAAVFRNIDVRRNVFTPVPGLQQANNGSGYQVSPTVVEGQQTERTE